jgi:hypothetical protein
VARGNQALSNAFPARLNEPSLAEVNFLLHPDQVFVHARFRSAIDQGVVAPN